MYAKYQKSIDENLKLNKHNWNFKSNPNYTNILEHVSHELGVIYLKEIKTNFDSLFLDNKEIFINLCLENDKYGMPNKYEFENFCSCSPTNLRYLLHALIILKYMQDCNLNNINIVEIGGGYGGLTLFIFKLSFLFKININSYTIFDLLEPMLLQKKYLDLFNIKINTYEISENFTLNNNSFLISNYAFSEISKELQSVYIKKMINPYISHGFLCWNHIPVYDFINDKIIDVEEEYPMTDLIYKNNKYIFVKPK
jgi:hypothetical protein